MAKQTVKTGMRFDRLVVVSRAEGHYRWLCLCDCGTSTVVYHYGLLNGHTTSCGCKRYASKPTLSLEIAGHRSGMLIALHPTGEVNAHGSLLWKCKCDCGNFTIVTATSFSTLKVRSCGCQQFSGSRLPDGVAAFNRVYRRYQNHALRAVRDFSLTKAQFHALTQQDCVYCGQGPVEQEHSYEHSYSTGKFFGNGIDRMDNNEGYTLSNSVPCCETCNRAKRALPIKTFTSWIGNLIARSADAEWERIALSGGC